MNPTEIKIELLRSGVSQAEIAKKTNVTRSMVNMVVNGKARSKKIEDIIAYEIGQPVEKVFLSTK